MDIGKVGLVLVAIISTVFIGLNSYAGKSPDGTMILLATSSVAALAGTAVPISIGNLFKKKDDSGKPNG